MGAGVMTVVCAWCHRVAKAGTAGAGVTHTICASCIDWMMDPIEPGDSVPPAVHDLEDLRAPADTGPLRAPTT